ncbi:MAG: helix-turn-helix transcriptional regulator [Lachnospiraceae bacterium]|nr:helix-turn-helix transcriptional regulator [Lachnospiraceae bacterium]
MENSIGKRLSKARKAKKITQEQLSELTGMSVSEISRIETGRNSTTIDTLLKFCEELDVGLDYLLFDYFPTDSDIQNPTVKQIVALIEPLSNRNLDFILNWINLYVSHLN